jgi:hypothetical protein
MLKPKSAFFGKNFFLLILAFTDFWLRKHSKTHGWPARPYSTKIIKGYAGKYDP